MFFACMNESQTTAPYEKNNKTTTVAKVDTFKLSDDNILIVYDSEPGFAARPIIMVGSDGIGRTRKWPDKKIIRYSFHGSHPSIARGIFDTTARYWTSLIDPDFPSSVTFQLADNNDNTADLKIFFPTNQSHPGWIAQAKVGVTGTPGDLSPLKVFTAEITFFSNTGTHTNNWNDRDLLFSTALHELGHVLGLADEPAPEYKSEVMGSGTPGRTFFGTDDIQSINELFHGSRTTYSKWIPIFQGGKTGWNAAANEYSLGRGVRLMGIALPITDNRPGLTTLYRFKRTDGSYAFWDEPSASSFTCSDAGLTAGQQGEPYVKLFANNAENTEPTTTGFIQDFSYVMTHKSTFSNGWTNLFQDSYQPNYGCQRQIGWVPNLRRW